MYAKLASLEEEKTKGYTTYQFRPPFVEAQNTLLEYVEHLTIIFQAIVDTLEGKQKETRNTTKEIERATTLLAERE